MVKKLTISFVMVLLAYGVPPASDAGSPSRDYATANKLFASSRFQEALSLYRKLLASPPPAVSIAEIQSRIGDTWFRLGSYQDALDAYRVAIRDQKESLRPETQYWIGFCCFLLGNDSEAIAEFLKIPDGYPRSGMWVSTAYYWAGRVAERMGKTEEAALYYRKAAGNGRSSQGAFAAGKAKAARGAAHAKSRAPDAE